MILVIGGAYQGKLEYVKERFHIQSDDIFNGESDSYETLVHKKVILNFHCLMKRYLLDNMNGFDEINKIMDINPELIIITDEIGYGIVPLDPFERRYREETGRVCCSLAKEAQEVIRVLCGIPTKIK